MKETNLYIASICILLFCVIKVDAQWTRLNYQPVWQQLTFPHFPQTIQLDNTDRNYFYVAHFQGGLSIYDNSNQNNPIRIKQIHPPAFDSLDVMDLVQQGNFLYLALGSFFNSTGNKYGLAVVDVSKPDSSNIRSIWTSDSVYSGSAIVRVRDSIAFLGAMNQGIIFFNTIDKDSIKFVSSFLPDQNFPRVNPPPVAEPNARGMAIRNNLLYLAYDAGGLRVIDISDLDNPIELSRYINRGALNTQQAYNNIVLHDNLAFVAEDYCGMEILDISDSLNVKAVSWWNPWRCDSSSNVWINSLGHTNQIIYSDSLKWVFMSAGGAELVVLDVADPQNPDSLNALGNRFNKLAVWGLDIRGTRAYLAYINAVVPFSGTWSGIKIVDLNPNTSVNKVERQTGISVYPNPFSTEIYLDNTTHHNNLQKIQLFSTDGKEILSLSPKLNSFSRLNLSEALPGINNIPKGIYLLKTTTSEGIHSFRISKI